MLKVHQYTLGELATNSYLVESQGKCLIIDPADLPEFLAEKIYLLNLKPQAIVATHGHFDHLLGARGLELIFKIPFFINHQDQFLVKKIKQSAEFWLKRPFEEPLPKIGKELKDKDKLKIGNEVLEVIATPGHTPGSVCFINKKNKILFSGDLVFKEGVGRTDFSYGSEKTLEKSIAKILKLSDDYIIYPGHGELTTLGEFKKFYQAHYGK